MSPAAKEAVEEMSAPDEEAMLSRDAANSTYAEVTPDEEKVPPDGMQVEQTRGVASEA